MEGSDSARTLPGLQGREGGEGVLRVVLAARFSAEARVDRDPWQTCLSRCRCDVARMRLSRESSRSTPPTDSRCGRRSSSSSSAAYATCVRAYSSGSTFVLTTEEGTVLGHRGRGVVHDCRRVIGGNHDGSMHTVSPATPVMLCSAARLCRSERGCSGLKASPRAQFPDVVTVGYVIRALQQVEVVTSSSSSSSLTRRCSCTFWASMSSCRRRGIELLVFSLHVAGFAGLFGRADKGRLRAGCAVVGVGDTVLHPKPRSATMPQCTQSNADSDCCLCS